MKNGQGDSLCMQRGVALFFHSIEMETEQRWKFLERRMGTVPGRKHYSDFLFSHFKQHRKILRRDGVWIPS